MADRILVLGIGNILLKDEGVGVKVVDKLAADYDFSTNVELYDGGTLGLRLMDPICNCEYLIVVDAVQNGKEPGAMYRLPTEEIEKRLDFRNSFHEMGLVDALAYAELMGNRPPKAVIIGIEPADISPWGLELTDVVQKRFDEMCSRVLEEIVAAGGSYSVKPRGPESKANLKE